MQRVVEAFSLAPAIEGLVDDALGAVSAIQGDIRTIIALASYESVHPGARAAAAPPPPPPLPCIHMGSSSSTLFMRW